MVRWMQYLGMLVYPKTFTTRTDEHLDLKFHHIGCWYIHLLNYSSANEKSDNAPFHNLAFKTFELIPALLHHENPVCSVLTQPYSRAAM